MKALVSFNICDVVQTIFLRYKPRNAEMFFVVVPLLDIIEHPGRYEVLLCILRNT